MPTPRHRALRHRSVLASVLLALLGSAALTVASLGGPPAATAATPVAKSSCARFDPNLVTGMCLRISGRSRIGYTWIGSYRADNGKVFFCIDYLYDSRIHSRAAVVDTERMQNQLGRRVGDAEVAALNYLISTWAPHGSSGSEWRDAAIALIIREVMSDAIRPDGTVVYRPGLKIGDTVAAPRGGLPGGMLKLARSMWREASWYRGPGRLVLSGGSARKLELGDSAEYRVAVLSAGKHPIPRLKVTFSCRGPITCPKPVTTRTKPVVVKVVPHALGHASITARALAPSSDGKLLQLTSWRSHGGRTARNNGVQRGWIGQRNSTAARATIETRIVKGTPTVRTRTSAPTALPGTKLTDLVTVSGLPAGSKQQVVATLFGPLSAPPGEESCTDEVKVDQVTVEVAGNGTVTTPPITVNEPGYYVWTESMPGDERANPVTTPCGIVEETTVVERPRTPAPRSPRVHTVASAAHLLVGGTVHDHVAVAGLPADASVVVRWNLLGPLPPRHGTCEGLDWTRAALLASGSFTADHDGSYLTKPVVLRAPGCVTFTERLAATPTTAEVSTRPGETSETALITRPAVPVVPEIPSGPVVGGR